MSRAMHGVSSRSRNMQTRSTEGCAQSKMRSPGRRRDDLRPGLRIFPVERHVILYEKHGDTVVVLRIVHQRQRLDDLAFE